MSFRNRLTFFFVVIVIVPMISVAVVLFRLISDNETGKADAGVAARAQAATQLYGRPQHSAAATAQIKRVGADRVLAQALAANDLARAQRRAVQLLTKYRVARIAVQRGTETVVDAGDPQAVAPIERLLVDASGRTLGRLEISNLTAPRYAQLVHDVTGLDVLVRGGNAVLASTLPGVTSTSLPRGGSPARVRLQGRTYRLVPLEAFGFGGHPVSVSLLSNQSHTSSAIRGSRLLAGGFVAVFFIIAFAFAILVSRSLQLQIGGFLNAARRLGSGDFSAEVPTSGRDEFAALGEEFNKMSLQLEQRLAELREQQGRLELAMQRIGETFASNLDRDALLEIVLRTAVEGVGATGGRASVRIDGEARFEERARVGRVEGQQDALRDAEAEALSSGQPQQQVRGDVSALAHPLTEGSPGGRVLGMLSVARTDRPFSAAEGDLFHYLAAQAAVSMENVDLHEKVQRQAVTDELTGLYNHRRFQEAISSEIERTRRFQQDLGLVMLDIDDFKQVNDSYGHQQGDLVLREVARILREYSREVDSPARYGGEELALLLPGTNAEGAFNLAERLRAGIESLAVRRLDGEGTIGVTASVGVASASGSASNARELIAAADAALYEAKRSGKNKTARAR